MSNLFYYDDLESQRSVADSFERYQQRKAILERHSSTRGRSTAEVEWRVWNKDLTCYQTFKTKREAVAYLAITNK